MMKRRTSILLSLTMFLTCIALTNVYAGVGRNDVRNPTNICNDIWKDSVELVNRNNGLGLSQSQDEQKNTPNISYGKKVHTRVIAHRGYWKKYGAAPNTITALEAAQKLGVYGSEFDVWITKDGVVVVNHDRTINGINIETSDYAKVKDITLSTDEQLPTLKDYLKQGKKVKSTRLVLEIKPHKRKVNNDRVAIASVKAVKSSGTIKNVEYISFSLYVCKKLVELLPDAMVSYLGGDASPQKLHQLGINGLDYNISVFRRHPEYVKEAHNLGMKVNVWTVNDKAGILEMLRLGVDYITTDSPLLAKQLIKGYFKDKKNKH